MCKCGLREVECGSEPCRRCCACALMLSTAWHKHAFWHGSLNRRFARTRPCIDTPAGVSHWQMTRMLLYYRAPEVFSSSWTKTKSCIVYVWFLLPFRGWLLHKSEPPEVRNFLGGHVITILQTTSLDNLDETKLCFTGDASCQDYKTLISMAPQTCHTQSVLSST